LLGAIKSGVLSLCPYAITFKSENELHFWVHEEWCACLLWGLQAQKASAKNGVRKGNLAVW